MTKTYITRLIVSCVILNVVTTMNSGRRPGGFSPHAQMHPEMGPWSKLKFLPQPRLQLTPQEKEETLAKLLASKYYQQSLNYLAGKLNSFELTSNKNNVVVRPGKCCGGRDEWVSYGGLGQHYRPMKPVHRPPGYLHTANQVIQKYRNVGDVKPVVEHIEDDLKYDFRTNTHSL